MTLDSLRPGLYAELLTNRFKALLREFGLRNADAAERLRRYFGTLVAEAVLPLDEDKRATGALDIFVSLLRRLHEQSPAGRIDGTCSPDDAPPA